MTEPMTSPGQPHPESPASEAPSIPCALRLETSTECPLDAWLQRRLVADARVIATGDTSRAPTIAHLRALLAWLDGDADVPVDPSTSHHLATRGQDVRP